MAKGIGTGAALLLAGAGAWVIWKMANANAAPLAPAPDQRTALEVATAEQLIPRDDETIQEFEDRMRFWEMQTGQVMPTFLEGYGAGAMDAWYSQPVYGDYVQLPYSGYG
jgi:hypothetical protein